MSNVELLQAIPDDAILVQERQRKETLRRVFIVPGAKVIKQYVISSKTPFYAKPWRLEKKAMLRAASTHRVARHIGTVHERLNSPTNSVTACITHTKTFLVGEPLVTVDEADAKSVAALLADLHTVGVITYDCQKENILRSSSYGFQCIDLGRARTYPFKSMRYYYGIGSEMARLMHRVFDDNEPLMQVFCQHYFNNIHFSRWQERLVLFFYRRSRRARTKRQRLK